ncbi:MAG TPA: LCP family protein [Gaiellaceae bacterium]|nr:LCP family protein [Gaiellaceae bacterium]
MAPDEKPYRVYRGGRRGPKLPTLSRRKRTPGRPAGAKRTRKALQRPPWRRALRWAAIGFSVFLLWVAAWGLAGYFSFRDGVKAANERLPAAAEKQLAGGNGLVLSNPTTILLLGTDTRPGRGQQGLRHSDSMMLVRTDPDHHRVSYLSIPRDLWVEIPGYGTDRINTSFQVGGAPLAIRTVRNLTGIDIDHVAVVDFQRFKELIDSIGGIDITVPRPILSNKFECPYDAQRCETWDGWRFAKGRQHMDGRRALVYSRVRENQLDPSDNDITRAERQQQVTQAIADKLVGVGTFLRLPFNGSDLLRPLATDLSASELLQLGWVKFRAGETVRCRLGGDPETIGGASVIRSSEENRSVISMFLDESALQPPRPGTGTFGPGCVAGGRRLGSR